MERGQASGCHFGQLLRRWWRHYGIAAGAPVPPVFIMVRNTIILEYHHPRTFLFLRITYWLPGQGEAHGVPSLNQLQAICIACNSRSRRFHALCACIFLP